MFAITGITGNVGGEVARNLLAAQQPVLGVVPDVLKSGDWTQRCREVVQADINDDRRHLEVGDRGGTPG